MLCRSPVLQNLLPLAVLWKQRFNQGEGGAASNNKVLWGSALTFILDMEKRGFPDSRKMHGRVL